MVDLRYVEREVLIAEAAAARRRRDLREEARILAQLRRLTTALLALECQIGG